jgi:hypothetical protein
VNKLRRHIVLAATAVIAIAGIALAVGIFWGLPRYIESRLIPHLAEAKGLNAAQVRVRRIGFNGADLGPIRIEAGSGQSISIAGVQIDYSIWGVLRKRIRGIVISGVKIVLTATSDGIRFGDSPRRNASPEPEGDHDIQLDRLSPVQMDSLKIVSSEIWLTHGARRIRLPLQIDLDTTGLHEGRLNGSLQLAPYGNELTLTARLDQSADHGLLRLHGDNLDIRSLAAMLPEQPLPHVSGKIDLEATSTVRLSTLGIEGLSIRAQVRQACLGPAAAVIENLSVGAVGKIPIEIAIDQTKPNQFDWRCAPFQISAPVVTQVDALAGRFSMGKSGWELTVNGETSTPAQAVISQWTLTAPLSLQWTATAQHAPTKPLAFEVHTKAKDSIALTANGIRTRYPNLSAKLHGQFNSGKLTSKFDLTGNPSILEWPNGRTRAERISLTGGLALDTAPAAPAYRVDLKSSIKHVTAETDAARMTLPAIAVEAAGGSDGNGPLQLKGRIIIKPGRLRGKKHPFLLDGISSHLPFQWPPARTPGTGRLKIDRIEHQELLLGALDGKIGQQGEGLSLALEHTSKLFPGLHVLINGAVGGQGGNLELSVPEYLLPQGFDLGRFWPRMTGMQFDGRVEASGRLKMDRGGISGTAQLLVDEGAIRSEVQDMALEGIHLKVQMDDLPGLISAPRQRLKVQRIRLGNLNAEKLAVDFQIESTRTLFIETAALQWCNGSINTGALRITPGRDDYELTLFCDRLDLAKVLEQLGAAEASGEGTVNGRIPLHWSDGSLTFDRGFLFSTPGKTGTIRLKGTQSLLTALPPDTPQHAQLDIATEALKDYTYKWARLYLESEDRDLLLKLQFDGKPNRLLPFAYDTGLGRFKRVSGEGGADFTGISIDLNFRSPLNEILRYRTIFNQN